MFAPYLWFSYSNFLMLIFLLVVLLPKFFDIISSRWCFHYSNFVILVFPTNGFTLYYFDISVTYYGFFTLTF